MNGKEVMWNGADNRAYVTAGQQAACDKFRWEEVVKKIVAQLPPEERKCHKVCDRWGNTIKRFRTAEEAFISALERNVRARRWGLWMGYRAAKDQGWDE